MQDRNALVGASFPSYSFAVERGKIRELAQAIGVPEKIRTMFAMICPLGRPATPEEAADSILMVASPMADYISGQVIRVTDSIRITRGALQWLLI